MCIRDRYITKRVIEDLFSPDCLQEKRNTQAVEVAANTVSYTHLRAHETRSNLVCRLLLEKIFFNDTATTEIYTRKIVGSVRCV